MDHCNLSSTNDHYTLKQYTVVIELAEIEIQNFSLQIE
jgi:hypothetical protein